MAAHAQAARLHPRLDARRLPVRERDVPPRRARAVGRDRRLGDGHRRRPEAGPRVDGAELAGGHRTRTVGDELRRYARNALSHRGDRPLRQGLRPSGRRPRLLPGAGEVEARDRARAGLPTRGRQREAAGLRARHRRPDAVGRRPRRIQRLQRDPRRGVPGVRAARGRPDRGAAVAAARGRSGEGAGRRRGGQLSRRPARRQPVPDQRAAAVRGRQRVRRRHRRSRRRSRRSGHRRPGDRNSDVRRLRRGGRGGGQGAGPDSGRRRRPHGRGVRGGPSNGVSRAALGRACALRATP